jgi:HAMP domain-containing protein
MRFPIRNKLIIAISILMVLVFSLAAYLFISEKKTELAEDIYLNTLAFSKLTAPDIAYNYDLYLAENSFVHFNRAVTEIFEQNDDVSILKVLAYSGEILYDSNEDVDKRYDGEIREIDDMDLLSQMRSENISMKTRDDQILFLKEGEFVNENEEKISAIEAGTLVDYFVIPASEKYSVLYEISYENLDQRIETMIQRIIYLAIFGILVGMLFSFVLSGQITRPIKKLVFGVNKIATGDFKTRVDIKTHDEIKFLGEAVNKMAGDLEKSMEARVYKARVANELKIAGEIQQRLIPKDIPKMKGLDVAAGIIPAEEIGGDMYDFIGLENGRYLMYLGDVTGHGVPAGIVSSIANAVFYGYSRETDLQKMILNVNTVLTAKTMPNMFMTLCLMEWNENEESFRYVSAGHDKILHYKASSKEVKFLQAGGMALGMADDISKGIELNDVDLETGDYLVIYSDGIPEAFRNDKECYGMDRFLAAAKQFGDLETSLAIKEAFLADVEEFVAGHPQSDDITIIVLKKT